MTKFRFTGLLAGIAMMLVTATTNGQDYQSLRNYLNQPGSSSTGNNYNTQSQSGGNCPTGSCSFSQGQPSQGQYQSQFDGAFNNTRDHFTQGSGSFDSYRSQNTPTYDQLLSRYRMESNSGRSQNSLNRDYRPSQNYSGNHETRRFNTDRLERFRNEDHFGTGSGTRTLPARYRSETQDSPRNFDSVRDNEMMDRLQQLRQQFDRLDGSGNYAPANRSNRPERNRDYDRQERPLDLDRGYDSRSRQQNNYGPRNDGRYQELQAPGYNRGPAMPSLNEQANSATDIRNSLTRRYSNPTVQRFLQTLTPERSMQLHSEISRMIDQRHYQPLPYNTRMESVRQHLDQAMSNSAFLSANRISANRASSFRSELNRYASNVNSLTEMQSAMQRLMSAAERDLGINPSVIAYEFIVASIAPLDKYSAFEPEDPGNISGAELKTDVKVAGLDEKVAALDETVVGIGVQIKQHDDGLLIEGTLKNGPANEVGLRKGDVIIGINGRKISGMTLGASADMISGRAGTPIMLEIARNGRPQTINLRRRSIKVLAVNEAKMLDKTSGVAYLKLDKFNSSSSAEIDQALWSLHRQGMKSLVFDVRGNPGGLLNECVDICNKFVPCGTIVQTRGRLASDNSIETANYQQTWKTPIVVLVDGNSASASEIFAAAIQDNERGLVMGEKSYGKGTVQTHFPLSSVRGKLRLTTARFYSPDGRLMSGAGVTPDVRVANSDSERDEALARAVTVAKGREVFELAEASRKCRVRNSAQSTDSTMGPIAKLGK